ncbi:uncharacterized protein LOC143888182 [Tasmannia lanceolata]|uniref:uncharacterized protein LOC143888182 n=1 Tax=Tasmannia lanceolata TaxID=3420 RepID=UPI004062C68B
MEEKEEGEETSNSFPSSRSSPPPRKRLLSSLNQTLISPHSSSLKSLNKSPNLPNFSNCHACGICIALKKGRFQTLDSEWRIVILCKECLFLIKSAAICSYCFAGISAGDETIDCRGCRRKVHRGCISKLHRGFVLISNFGSFTCVDCWVPKSRVNSNRSSIRLSSSCSKKYSRVSRLKNCSHSLEDVVKDANLTATKAIVVASRAKEKARRKAFMARRAAELAKDALDLARAVAKEGQGRNSQLGCDLDIDDNELAFRLHRAMNSSPRIYKNLGFSNLNCLDKKHQCNGDYLGIKVVNSGSHSVYGKLQVCSDNKLFENPDKNDVEHCDSSVDLDGKKINHDEERKEETGLVERYDGRSLTGQLVKSDAKDNRLEMPVKEEQASCSMVINSSGDDNGVNSKSESSLEQNESKNRVSLKCSTPNSPPGDDGHSSKLLKKGSLGPNRYLIKYSKRNSSAKLILGRNNKSISQDFPLESSASAPLLPCRQQNCFKASRTISDASYHSTSAQLQPSACASGPSKFQS